jgi:opacity protein-like surface antigen
MSARGALVLSAFVLATGAIDARAQDRLEAQPFVGARFGGEFEAQERIRGRTRTVNIDIESGFAWGFTFGAFVNETIEFEFMWSRQESALSVEPDTKLFDASVSHYHGNVLFHFGNLASRVRPYALVGLGATILDPDAGDVEGATKFSFGIGGGLKAYFNDTVGLRAQYRLTPTYMSDEPAIFCDAFAFCYVIDEAVYAYQNEWTAGVTFRF